MVEIEAANVQKQLIKWFQIHLFLLLLVSRQTVLGGNIVKYLPGYVGELPFKLETGQTVLGGNIVKYLPGYVGELPFKLETGYISVDDSELFYYFIESEGNPETDPLFLWQTGGPGCTAFSGLAFEIGPLEYDSENYTGGFPNLRYYPYARTKVASIIFLDAPVGTGFSYSRTPEGWLSSDTKSSEQSYVFLRKWLIEHPQFLSVDLYIGGDSYAGLTVPLITKKIIEGNSKKQEPYINIKGYLVGAPFTDKFIDENSFVDYAHRMALISDEIYESAKMSCNGNYVNYDPQNSACIAAVGAVQKCVKPLNTKNILEPNCHLSSPNRRESVYHRSLEESQRDSLVLNPCAPENDISYKVNIWANDERVREALHVRKGTKGDLVRCNYSLAYDYDVSSVVAVHKELSHMDLKVLVECGDHDLAIPYLGTLKWIKSLNLSVADDWRPWFVDNQVEGYTTQYFDRGGYRLTFATVKGAGHPAPEHRRKECYYLFDSWIRNLRL